jgi:hypothetical protein
MKKTLISGLLLAGLAGGLTAAQAQTLVYPATVAPAVTYVVPAAPVSPVLYYAPVTVHTAPHAYDYTRASLTSDVPTRAGEATTYTNGAPNLVTNNSAAYPVAQVYVSPYAYPYGYTLRY